VQVERGRVDRELRCAGAHVDGCAVELRRALLDRRKRVLLGHPTDVYVADDDARQHVAALGDALDHRDHDDEQEDPRYGEHDHHEALVVPGAPERGSTWRVEGR